MSGYAIDVEVRSQLLCAVCDGGLLLSVRVPVEHVWSGRRVQGVRTATLCPRCHRDDPAAQGVLAFFAVHSRITRDTVSAAGGVIREWLDLVIAHPPVCSEEDLADDIAQWERENW